MAIRQQRSWGDQAWQSGQRYACVGQEHGDDTSWGLGCLPQPTADDGCQQYQQRRRIQCGHPSTVGGKTNCITKKGTARRQQAWPI